MKQRGKQPTLNKTTAILLVFFLLIPSFFLSPYNNALATNASWNQTLQSEFNLGTNNGTQVVATGDGSVEMAQTTGSYNWDFSTPASYTYDSSKVEVNFQSNGYGELRPQSYIIDGNTVGLWHMDDASGNATDSSVNAYHLTPYNSPTYSQAGRVGTSVSFNGSSQYFSIDDATAPNLSITGSLSIEAWIYPTVPNKTQTIISKWREGGAGNNNRSYEMQIDNQERINFHISQLGTVGTTTNVISTSSIPMNQWTHVAGTYDGATTMKIYINGVLNNSGSTAGKVGIRDGTAEFCLGRTSFDANQFAGRIDEARVSNTARTSFYSLPSDKPTIYPTTSFAPSTILSWTGFTETAIKNGGEIYYQLSDDDGVTWKWWNGATWTNAVNPTDYNTASVINTNITFFPTTNKKLRFKAFLSSNGSQDVKLDNIQVSYINYPTSSYYTSVAKDTLSDTTQYDILGWTENVPTNTDLKFQIRTATTAGGLTSASWLGPDGTGSTYYTNPAGENIHSTHDGNRWIQYRAYFTSTSGDATARLDDITISYGSPPTFNITINPTSPVKAGNITITATASEALAGAPTLGVRQNGAPAYTPVAMAGGPLVWTGTYTVTSGFDGIADINCVGTDNWFHTGNQITTGETFFVDTVNPSVTAPTTATPTYDSTPSWSWTPATDPSPSSGISSYDIRVSTLSGGGGTIIDSATGISSTNWTQTAAFPTDDQTYYCNIRTADNAGNVSGWSEGTVYYDAQYSAPTGYMVINEGTTYPDYTNNNLVDLHLHAQSLYSGPGTGVYAYRLSNDPTFATYLEVSISGSPGTFDATGISWNLSAYGGSLTEGLHTVYVRYQEESTSVWSDSYTDTITYDITDPVAPIITYPASGQRFTNATATTNVTGYTDIAEAGGTAKIYLNNSPTPYTTTTVQIDGTFSFTNIPLDLTGIGQGINKIDVTIEDKATNEGSADTVNVTRNTPPSVTLTAPTGSEKWFGTNNITWNASDFNNDSLTFRLYYSADSGVTWNLIAINVTGTSYAWNTSLVPDGTTYRIRILANDGLEVTPDISLSDFSINNNPPTITITPLSPDPTNDTTPTLQGLAEGHNTHTITGVEYTLDNGLNWITALPKDGSFNSNLEAYTLTTAALSDNTYTIKVRAKDNLNFYTLIANYAQDTFTIDTTRPVTPQITYPVNGQFISNQDDVDSGTSGIQTKVIGKVEANNYVTVTCNGQNYYTSANASGSFTITGIDLVHGENIIYVKSRDAAGNISYTKSITVIANNLPEVTIKSPTSSDFWSGQHTINWTGIDIDGDSLTYTVVITNGSQSFTLIRETSATSLDINTESFSDGYWRIIVTAYDGYEQANAYSDYFVIDNTKPTTSINRLYRDATKEKNPLFDGQASDNLSGVVYVEFKIDNDPWFKAIIREGYLLKKTDWYFSCFANLSDGEHRLQMRITDRAGNVGFSDVYKFTIDTSPPRLGPNMIVLGSQVIMPDSSDVLELVAGTQQKFAISVSGNPIKVVLKIADQAIELEYNVKTGLFEGSFSISNSGKYPIYIETEDDLGNKATKQIGMALVDPYGYVYDKESGQHIKDASVSLYFWKEDAKSWTLWNAEAFGQTNPQTTNDDGNYSFMVPEGKYYLEVKANSYETYTSETFEVKNNKPVNLNIPLAKVSPWKMALIILAIILGIIFIIVSIRFYKKSRTHYGNTKISKI